VSVVLLLIGDYFFLHGNPKARLAEEELDPYRFAQAALTSSRRDRLTLLLKFFFRGKQEIPLLAPWISRLDQS
jgi:hypothetical protein